ncbi:MAG TPA: hypothetical protein PK089_08800 [Methanoregulaceae archaeon]|nr:hypothetical protein [Methanoregulaceae archaeon]HQJ86986.1 hypothetical protein [Methanoregulaceae archaeon]
MRGEQLSDAIEYERLDLLRKDFVGYISKHRSKVEENLPVFFGHVITALENSFPNLSDSHFDEFIDAITFKLLDDPDRPLTHDTIERIKTNALRTKRGKESGRTTDLVIGLTLFKQEDWYHAAEYLRAHVEKDAGLGIALAYCYYRLGLERSEKTGSQGSGISDIRELEAREVMIGLAQREARLRSLHHHELMELGFLVRPFWTMIFASLEWFPSEKYFLRIGLQRARESGDLVRREQLLNIGIERFFDDMTFLRELYALKLEQRDGAGAAGVLKQMMQQSPGALEPIYYGLKLSLLTTRRITYFSFRRLAVANGMPAHLITILDYVFALFSERPGEAVGIMRDLRYNHPELLSMETAMEYIARDLSSEDKNRAKRAKKALVNMVDYYCMESLGIPH